MSETRPGRGLAIAWVLPATTLGGLMVVIALGLYALAAANQAALRSDLEDRSLQTARLIGAYAASDLNFNDPQDLARLLESFRGDPELLAIGVYTRDGGMFGRFEAAGATPLPATVPVPPVKETRFSPGFAEVRLPIRQGDEVLGEVLLRASTRSLHARITTYGRWLLLIASIVFMMGVLIAWLIRHLLVRPVEQLARTLQLISKTGDYTVRVPQGAGRELAALSEAFNTMLGTVELRQRQRELAENNQRRYAERLRALRFIEAGVVEGQAASTVCARAVDRLFRLLDCQFVAILEAESEGPPVSLHAWGRDGEVSPDRVSGSAVLALARAVRDIARPSTNFSLLMPETVVPEDWRPGFGAQAIRWVRVNPLLVSGRPLGALMIGRRNVKALDREAGQVVDDVAEVLALCLQQARLTSEVYRHTQELERRVSIRTAQLADSNRELEGFAYSVAHDLRSPLRAMQGFSNALLEDYSERLDDVGREFLHRIATASQRMDRLIRDLLDYSRLSVDSLVLEGVRLDEVTHEVLTSAATMIEERGATVEVRVEPVTVWGHRASLVQMLTNLVANALKFVESGTPPKVVIRTELREDRVRLWVEDNGIGIPPEHQERIFRVFERLHAPDEFPGTGIGLALVKKGAERLGGLVGVDSTPGRGSRFFVELVVV